MQLRQRFVLATGLLLGLQVASSSLALSSFRLVTDAASREADWALVRGDVVLLHAALRDEYAHMAHTFVEGGPGHLGHGADVIVATDGAIAALQARELPAEDRALVDAIAADQRTAVAYFETRVAPLARGGTLDQATASRLHAEVETVIDRATGRVTTLLDRVEGYQASERERARLAASRAWRATAALSVAGLALVLVLARALARSVLAPVDAIRAAAEGVGERGGDLDELAAAFDRVTARLRATEERRVRDERLEALGEMSAAIAHELNNPLTVILGHAASDPALAPIRAEATHARRIVDGLLGFARPGEEAPREVPLLDAARASADRLLPIADPRDVRIEVSGRPRTLVASPSAVRVILDNLVRNAVLASPDGGCVELAVGDAVSVADRGPGLPAEVRARLYEPFVTGRPEGTGLGIAIASRIARGMGGALAHADRPGGGTIATWTPEVADA